MSTKRRNVMAGALTLADGSRVGIRDGTLVEDGGRWRAVLHVDAAAHRDDVDLAGAVQVHLTGDLCDWEGQGRVLGADWAESALTVEGDEPLTQRPAVGA